MLASLNFSSFFSMVQETPWYTVFLTSILSEIEAGEKVLDIGTGPGKFIQLLQANNKAFGVGVDTSDEMIREAKRKNNGNPAQFLQTFPGRELPFREASFDTVCISNLLFHLRPEDQNFILLESLRIAQPGGRIFILHPGTARHPWEAIVKAPHWSFALWYCMTYRKSRIYERSDFIRTFARQHGLTLTSQEVFNRFGRLSTLLKTSF
jgi:SAM-dependent methyltransferase